jgi:hypothetical protein
MSRIRHSLIIAAVAALASVTCAEAGGVRDGSAYEARMQVAGKEVGASLESISKASALSYRYPVRPTAAREAAAFLTNARVNLRDAAKRLKVIVPPRAVTKQHAALAAGASELATELSPIIVQLKKGYLIAVGRLATLHGIPAVATALSSLKKHGYQIT